LTFSSANGTMPNKRDKPRHDGPYPPIAEAMKNDPPTDQVHLELEHYRGALEGGQNVGADPRLEEMLLSLLDRKTYPGAFLTQVKRLAELCRKLQTGDADGKASRPRLAEGLAKLLARWPGRESTAGEARPPLPPAPPSSMGDVETTHGAGELVAVFLQGQQDRLQEFEALVLEKEKGNTGALARLLGLLHNLKGEYGVLGFGEWADVIHGVESLLNDDKLLTDDLLQLVDTLTQ
jgi:HPt (histidine-containing phosphotransfer) domain-containing protein